MEKLYDFNQYKQNTRTYGGTAGIKIGITMDGINYMLKYPGKLKDLNLKNVELSYSNSPECEHLGCKIFQAIGIPAQKTLLGIRNQKIVVACEDFCSRGDVLIPFRDIKATFEPAFTDPQGDITNGTGTNLSEILRTLEEHPLFASLPEAKERFWDTFIVDMLIGNPDRNNDNWGLIRDINGEFHLPPVYDCGNCFNNKMSDRQIKLTLEEPEKLKDAAMHRPCIFESRPGKRISASKYIQTHQNTDCDAALLRTVPRINLQYLQTIVAETYGLTDAQREFFSILLQYRYEQCLYPEYLKVLEAKSS